QNGVIWEGLLPLLFPKIPVVVTVHDVTRHPIQKFQFVTPQFLLDFVAKSADSLIVHGEKLREKAREYYKPKAKIHVVPHGVITRYGGSSGKVSTGSNVLLFGTIDKWKGVEFLVQAEPLVREKLPDLQVKIAGGCRDITYYTSLTSKDQHVEMILRKQSPEEVNWLFEWADIIVLPYIEASQSGVLNLALNYCLPPVVTDVGALPDVVSNGRNGLIVEPENSSALAEAILRLLTDEELRANVVQNLSKDKAGIHSRNSIAAQTLKVYRNTVSTAYYVGK
ncbi:MAG: glycosyltransferase family 4 protein, partial [Nitrospira sp.]|nr:glycosyltransferase family 4 protein [Nitrospira sp.]